MSKQKCKVECNERGEVIRVIVIEEDIQEQTQDVPTVKKGRKGK